MCTYASTILLLYSGRIIMLNPLYIERIAHNDTHVSLSRKIGMSRTTISKIELGKISTFRMSTLQKLSQYITYDIEEFAERYFEWKEQHKKNLHKKGELQ